MRKTLYIVTMVLGMFGFSSCSDYLDKESDTELDLKMVFEDKTRTEGWLANVYSGIPDPYLGYLQYEGWEILGDDMTHSFYFGNDTFRALSPVQWLECHSFYFG